MYETNISEDYTREETTNFGHLIRGKGKRKGHDAEESKEGIGKMM